MVVNRGFCFLDFLTCLNCSLSPSIPPAASSPSLPASPHVGHPSSLAGPPFVPGGARPSFLQLQPLLLLPEPVHGAPTQPGSQTRPPGFIWPLLGHTGKQTSELTEDEAHSTPTAEANRLHTCVSPSTAHIRAHPLSVSPSVRLPPLRACGQREG